MPISVTSSEIVNATQSGSLPKLMYWPRVGLDPEMETGQDFDP